ncbi:AAA family ATPase [Burkholderia cepacia]|uniref:AAA family ATPase n=1 Tax=Burkholderia cepacia TaxID=292 RepID=UPI002ABE5586|nr:AAA family ATPase [Burkholderia cepacia]
MYLREIYIENNGVIEHLHLSPGFAQNGEPKPFVLVGGNGSGKTNVLSMAADALFEVAAIHYTDVTPSSGQGGRAWFRIVGSNSVKVGSPGSVVILRLAHGDSEFAYVEKAGRLVATDVQQRTPASLRNFVAWETDGNSKTCAVSSDVAKRSYDEGAYVYFPSSRSETPYWLNQGSLPPTGFDLTPRYSHQLNKPIFVEKGLEKLKQWLLSVLLEVRADVQPVFANNQVHWVAAGNTARIAPAHALWGNLNTILRTILDSPTARLTWLGRYNKAGIGYAMTDLSPSLPLESLSAGQGTLFNIFGTLMRYGDGTTAGEIPVSGNITGMCVVDEIDSHMHIDLQYRAIPALIKMFPKVQFILSSHSPLFVLGMEKVFPEGAFNLFDMPSGEPMQAEAYTEFGRALDILQETHAFNDQIRRVANEPGKLLVLVEGETDPLYIKTAIELLGFANILDAVEIEWVGAKDPKRGEGFNTGKDSLNSAYNFLRAKPELVERPVCFLYDNDARKADVDDGQLSIRTIPTNPDNEEMRFGIENMLPLSVFTDDVFDTKENNRGNGTYTTIRSLNKMRLCQKICTEDRNREHFQGFVPLLQVIASVAHSLTGYEIPAELKRVDGKVNVVANGSPTTNAAS